MRYQILFLRELQICMWKSNLEALCKLKLDVWEGDAQCCSSNITGLENSH